MLTRMSPCYNGLLRPLSVCVRTASNSSMTNVDELVSGDKDKKMSRAMRYYLQKRRNYEEFIGHHQAEFDIGKQHLANMMGVDSKTMTQKDIDEAIEYLFPSGLIDPKARPIMKPPEEIYNKVQDAVFDYAGRPKHNFFYTSKPLYTQSLYDLAENISQVMAFGDRMNSLGVPENPDEILNENIMAGTRWMNKDELTEKFNGEKIIRTDVEYLHQSFDRLVQLPFSYRAKDFVFMFRINVATVIDGRHEIAQPVYDEEGRGSVEHVGERKTAVAKVKVTKPGSGEFVIRHVDYMDIENDITYFFDYVDRHACMYPLQLTKLLGQVDVECLVGSGGSTGQAESIRYAMAMALRSFVDQETVEEMKSLGLLTQNIRSRERKKFGMEGARKKFKYLRR